MDPFVGFTFVELDASDPKKVRIVRNEERRERADLIARQFHDVLTARDPADTSPQGMVLTGDFKISGQVTQTAGWLTFYVDKGEDKIWYFGLTKPGKAALDVVPWHAPWWKRKD